MIGFSPVARFAAAPENHKPQDIMPDAESVIVLARAFLSGPMKNKHWTSYTAVHDGNITRLDHDAYHLSRFVEENFGANALPVPAMTPYFHWDEAKQYAAGDLSHKHAAVAAGLGVMGKNHLLITPQYGNRVNLVSIVTDLLIEPTALLEKELCPSSCSLCIDACPARALQQNSPINQTACRSHCWTKLSRAFPCCSVGNAAKFVRQADISPSLLWQTDPLSICQRLYAFMTRAASKQVFQPT